MTGIETLIASGLSAASSLTLTEALALGGTAAGVAGTVASGAAAKQAAKIEQKSLKAQASDERASAQREAELERRRTGLVLSEQRAKAATSGAGVTGTVLDLMASTSAEGKLKSDIANYGGATAAAGLKDKAAATGFRAKADYTGTLLDAAGQGLTGAYKLRKGF